MTETEQETAFDLTLTPFDIEIVLSLKYNTFFREYKEKDIITLLNNYNNQQDEYVRLKTELEFSKSVLNRPYNNIKTSFRNRHIALEEILDGDLERSRPTDKGNREAIQLYFWEAFRLYYNSIHTEATLFMFDKHSRFVRYRNNIASKPLLASVALDVERSKKLEMYHLGKKLFYFIYQEKESSKANRKRRMGDARTSLRLFNKLMNKAQKNFSSIEKKQALLTARQEIFYNQDWSVFETIMNNLKKELENLPRTEQQVDALIEGFQINI